MYVYRCEDSLESIFAAIYRAYEDRHGREQVMLSLEDEPMLFAEEIVVLPDRERYEKVSRTIRKQFGEENYRALCLALSSEDSRKAQAVYVTVAKGLESKCIRGHLFDNLADENVNRAFKLARNADREYCHFRGFTRFEELENGVIYGKIAPRNHVLPFLMTHFADRFSEENFILQDTGRDLYGIHSAGTAEEPDEWCLVQGTLISPEKLLRSENEMRYQMLFKQFCKSVAIDSRRNIPLQRNMLPLHFREYMTEFH